MTGSDCWVAIVRFSPSLSFLFFPPCIYKHYLYLYPLLHVTDILFCPVFVYHPSLLLVRNRVIIGASVCNVIKIKRLEMTTLVIRHYIDSVMLSIELRHCFPMSFKLIRQNGDL